MPYKFIHDTEQVRLFYSLLAPLKDDEAYFLSASMRKKYLTDEQRKVLDIGSKEMFDRRLVKEKSFESYLRELRTFEISDGGYEGRSHLPIPQDCIVLYANINPCSGRKALKEFYKTTHDLIFDLDNKDNRKRMAGLDSELMSCFQRARGQNTLIDIDCDIPTEGIDLVKTMLAEFKEHGVKYHVVQTAGGFHILIEKVTLRYNYEKVIEDCDLIAKERYGKVEIKKNDNRMIPCPGTLAANFPVRFVEL